MKGAELPGRRKLVRHQFHHSLRSYPQGTSAPEGPNPVGLGAVRPTQYLCLLANATRVTEGSEGVGINRAYELARKAVQLSPSLPVGRDILEGCLAERSRRRKKVPTAGRRPG
jgi:hypothetical protein